MELGIKGNETRGDEIIEILEMLGGKNRHKMSGSIHDNYFYYIDGEYKDISYSYIGPDEIKGYKIFSLEDFLEKYPYKVGDKVNIYVQSDDIEGYLDVDVAEITSMRWDPTWWWIVYKMKGIDREFCVEDIKSKVIDITLKTSKNMEEKKINQMSLANCDLDEVEIVLGDSFELKIEDGKYYAVRKKLTYADENPFHTTNEYEEIVENSFQGGYEKCKLDIQLNGYELPDGYHFTDENGNVIDTTKILIKKNSPTYPTTYADCCKVIGCRAIMGFTGLDDEEENLYGKFIALKRCRDAYWKIAGEQMGLGKPWEPDWNNNDQPKFGIHNVQNNICTINLRVLKNLILVFPTIEMREYFHKNFKNLIETCKELL